MPAKRQTLKNITKPFNDDRQARALRQQLENVQQDLANQRAAFVALTAKMDAANVAGLGNNNGAQTNPPQLFTQP